MASDVGVCIDQIVIVESLELLDLLVWEHDVASESLCHQYIPIVTDRDREDCREAHA